MNPVKMKLGVHVSIAGKISEAVPRAESLGCNTIQIFSRNPRIWEQKKLSDDDALEFREKLKRSNIDPVFIHVPYLTNLASPDRSVFETPENIQTKTNRFDNQKCVERELEGNPTLLAEQPFDMRRSPPAAITERIRGHRRPDVVCLAAPGPAAGLNITRIVEMKFPGDAWNDGQQRAYERIAKENNPDATVEMIDGESEPCICEKSQ